MNRFNSMLSSHFSGYPCVGEVPDKSKARLIRVFDVGDERVVGAFDGIDAWMVPKIAAIGGITVQSMLLNPQQYKQLEGAKRERKKIVDFDDGGSRESKPTTSRPRRTLLL